MKVTARGPRSDGSVGCAAPGRNSLSIQTFHAERSILMRLAVICAAILTLAAGGALAQETPTSQSPASRQPSTVGAAWQAPVGHRQPRLSDLPPDLARQEEQFAEPPKSAEPSRAGQDRNIDPHPHICRGCRGGLAPHPSGAALPPLEPKAAPGIDSPRDLSGVM